jgi:hypothetical protein
MGIVRKDDTEFGSPGRAGFGKSSGNRAIDQPRQRGLIGPVACFDRHIDVDGNRNIPAARPSVLSHAAASSYWSG